MRYACLLYTPAHTDPNKRHLGKGLEHSLATRGNCHSLSCQKNRLYPGRFPSFCPRWPGELCRTVLPHRYVICSVWLLSRFIQLYHACINNSFLVMAKYFIVYIQPHFIYLVVNECLGCFHFFWILWTNFAFIFMYKYFSKLSFPNGVSKRIKYNFKCFII